MSQHPAIANRAEIEATVRQLLRLLGEDPDRPGIKDTPRRVAKWWGEFLAYDPGNLGTTFEATDSAGLVVVARMPVWSLCEHHLLPFSARVAIVYRPSGTVLGLSKFGRVAQKHAHRLQLQERLVSGIGQEMVDLTGSQDVGVCATGEHLCMVTRGVRSEHAMTSVWWSGCFKDSDALQAQFLNLVRNS